MRHNYPKFFLLTILLSLNLNLSVFGQELVLEMPFNEQLSFATQIVEGKVIKKKSYWDSNLNAIYTVNTVEVYKVFKGRNLKTVNIVTPGGFINDYGMNVYPSLKFQNKDLGLFMLYEKNMSLADNANTKFFKIVGTTQGFYKYDIFKDVFANPYKAKNGIVENLYRNIIASSQQDFIEVKSFDVEKKRNLLQRQAAPNVITSISPTTISAGTQSILTISGDNFGNTQGTVSFPFANDGGETYVDAYDTHIESWTDTEILVKVPSFAGTGRVRVTTSSNVVFLSVNLVIAYAHLNIELQDAPTPEEYPTQLYDKNNNGGYDFFYDSFVNSNSNITESFERAFFNWVCTSGVNWTLGGGTELDPNLVGEPADGVNVIGFRNDVDDDPSDGTVLAYAISRFIGCGNASGGVDVAVEDTDLVYNSDISFYYGTGNPGRSQIDFETVSLHELGHAHQLGHVIDPGALMHFSVSGRTPVRDFEPNDITGAVAVFNRSANDQICSLPLMTASSCSLSTDDLIADSFIIYPNPAENILNIATPIGISLKGMDLIDSRGRVVLTKEMTSENINIIKVDDISNGIYFLRINTENSSITKKVIIQ